MAASGPALRPAGMPRAADGPLPWLVAGAVAAAGVGALTYANSQLMFDLVLAAVAIAGFLRWPYLLLLVVLATAFRDNQGLELFTLVGGGVALLAAGRRSQGSAVAVFFLLLVVIALRHIPLGPTYSDGTQPANLYIPLSGIAYLPNPSNALLAWIRLAFLLVAFLLAVWTIRDERRLRVAIGVALAGAAIPVYEGLHQYVSGQFVARAGSTTKAVEGPFTFPNYFAFYLLGVLVMALVLLLNTRSRRAQAALVLLLAGGGVCFFLTYTRSAWIGLGAALLVIGIFQYRWMIPVGAVALVCAAFLLPGTVKAVNSRFGDLSANSAAHATNSWTWRTGQWSRMLPYGLHHPLTGTGFGSYPAVTVREFGYEDHTYPTLADPLHPDASLKGFTAHNDYVRMLVEMGFPGLVLWSAVLLALLASVIRAARVPSLRPFAVGTAAVLVALIGASFSDNVQAYTMDLLLPLVLAGGLASVARRERGLRSASRTA